MDVIARMIKWIFTGSIYGAAALAVVAFLIAATLQRVFKSSPSPPAFAAITFFVAILLLPSWPRYQFENESTAQLYDKPYVRVINTTKWGAFTEPLTWVNAPIGSFYAVMPNPPKQGGFREIFLRYEEEPLHVMVEPNCAASTVLRAEPSADGYFHYTSSKPTPMTSDDQEIFCDYDWSKEMEALRAEYFKSRNAQ